MKSVANPGANPLVPSTLMLCPVIKYMDGKSVDVIFLAIPRTISRMGKKRISL